MLVIISKVFSPLVLCSLRGLAFQTPRSYILIYGNIFNTIIMAILTITVIIMLAETSEKGPQRIIIIEQIMNEDKECMTNPTK